MPQSRGDGLGPTFECTYICSPVVSPVMAVPVVSPVMAVPVVFCHDPAMIVCPVGAAARAEGSQLPVAGGLWAEGTAVPCTHIVSE